MRSTADLPMKTSFSRSIIISFLVVIACLPASGQELLPPALPWKGKSVELIAKKDHPWITPTERSDFRTTPSYEETMQWLDKLCTATTMMKMITIGKSAQYRDIKMVIASREGFDKVALKKSSKPLLLIQAGIHSGEIDGKDAGMMLLRDIAFGNKKNLLDRVNILFIPILSVDAHERTSAYNRVNQRGPENMGWRTNARNLNLNRDYSKLDTEEVKAVVGVISDYDPEMYLDLHVTDGADYQYDITYGFGDGYSPSIASWMKIYLTPIVDKQLKSFGHIPGPLVFAANDMDFTDGLIEFPYSPRFSNHYGDARHVPSILLENHSLKPFRQRVLGTYVFLEGVISALSSGGPALRQAIADDISRKPSEIVLTWKQAEKKDTINFLGIESSREKSSLTGSEYVVWKGKAIQQRVPITRFNNPDIKSSRPKAFWIPSTYKEVIERLRAHGIMLEVLTSEEKVKVSMFRVTSHKFASTPNEGRFTVTASFSKETHDEVFYPGSVRVDTDQPLGDLAVLLLHPQSPDSFFQWGFFPEIFSRTEYIETYVIEPLAEKMLKENPALKEEFENKKKSDPAFANSPSAIYQWFYSRSPYFDSRWLLYPVGMEE
jgi:hypothetical protein